MSEHRRYIPTPKGFLMALGQGDDVFAQLEALMLEEAVPSASFIGGFARQATFGFFDSEMKTYRPKTLEVTNLTGTRLGRKESPWSMP